MDFIVRVRDSVASGKGLGPRMLLACMTDGPGKYSTGMGMLNAASEIPAAVKHMQAAGCAQVKIYSALRPDLVAPLARAAHEAGMTVTGHIPQGMGPMQGLDAGMDMINHVDEVALAFFQVADRGAALGTPAWTRAALSIDLTSVASKKTIARMVRAHLVLDKTLAISEAGSRSYAEMERVEPGLGKVAPPLRGPLSSLFGVAPEGAELAAKRLAKLKEIVQVLHAAGLAIVAGTDQAVPGHSLHRELELYVEAGFTPLEAIQAATIVPARAMKRDKELGTLESGKLADLIVVDGDPLADIHALRRTVTVVSDGRLYETDPLWRLADFIP